MRIGRLSVQALVVATLLFVTADTTWASEEFAVIVNSSNDRDQMDRREVRGHYLLQTQRWGTDPASFELPDEIKAMLEDR